MDNKLIVITCQHRRTFTTTPWYFDVEKQAALVIAFLFSIDHDFSVRFMNDPVPEGDFVTSAEEFTNWFNDIG